MNCDLDHVTARTSAERWIGSTLGRKEMFYLRTQSTHFIYGYMASDIWFRTILIVRKKTSCRHIGYSVRLTARVLLYAPSHRQDSTYHGLPVVEHWLEREIAQWVHTMKDRSNDLSHHERTLIPLSYGSILALRGYSAPLGVLLITSCELSVLQLVFNVQK